jgi:hypothetical protein
MRAAVLGVALALGLLETAPAAADPPSAPRATMHRIYEALVVLLPASFDEDAFRDPQRRAGLRDALHTLESGAAQLQSHAERRDAGFRFLSASLERDVHEVVWLFERGELEGAGHQLGALTNDCVACHSRLPSAREFPLADRLLERVDLPALDPPERARLLIALRRFDAALGVWEAEFADPAVSPAELDISGALVDYLVIAIRVEGDLARSRRALEGLRARPDTPTYLGRHLTIWIEGLGELSRTARAEPTLANARRLVERANALSLFPAGRERLVYDLVASSLLHRYVAAAPEGDPGLAEAYYLLGVIEARTVDSYWVPQTELHLEAAIRADPRGAFAEPAYAALEEYVLVGYGGLDPEAIPAPVRAHLAELRALIAEPAPAGGASP